MGLNASQPGGDPKPLLAVGGGDGDLSTADLEAALDALVASEMALGTPPGRVLLVPPDHTRTHGRAGLITRLLFDRFTANGCAVAVLPALGTHRAMTRAQVTTAFGELPPDQVLDHHWRDRVTRVGLITAEEMSALSGGGITAPLPVDVSEPLLEGWDLVVSIGQVVPHEVIGMANFTKNLVIGLGGAEIIGRSHLLGALCDMEKIMGRVSTPVRDLVDLAFDRFLSGRIRVLWVLTVAEATPAGVMQRGLFCGHGGTAESGGAAYRAAAELSSRCNITAVEAPLPRVVCWADPDEFTTTWLANKAVYRTRMALADGAELVLLAPGVGRFGEDDEIDRLIRRHGYRGTAATMAAVADDPELAANPGAAAHLIHGSSEGRFSIVYCTDPDAGGLTPQELASVGYGWRPLNDELSRLGIDTRTPSGSRRDRNGADFTFITHPALGLWVAPASQASSPI